ncbi:MAG TPA: aquaporin [Candidatus Limnocylindria bacterium]|nr:aquaporin [Candidatus Limnocylindria bacterium]
MTEPVLSPPGSRWSLYAIEAVATAVLVGAAGVYTLAVQHPASPLRAVLTDPLARRFAIGSAMGATITAIAYSPWGRRSGAHCNPALTLAFFRLGKVTRGDAYGYVAAQFAGALAGAASVAALWRTALAHPAVHWYVTVPGTLGAAGAFAAEFAVTAALLATIVHAMRSARGRGLTPVFAATIVMLAITLESPLSGTGLNPARSAATAAVSGIWTGLWIYLTAPVCGMLLAASAFARGGVPCAKLVHDTGRPCQFLGCAFTLDALRREPPNGAALLLHGGHS